MDNAVTIITWDKKYRDDFILLNREWIERYFRLETCDFKLLGNPEGEIIDKGGEIFFAIKDNKAVGCCALVYHQDSGSYELAKMAVSPAEQSHGIGYELASFLVSFAKKKGIRKLFLEANTKLKASVKLYYKLGFEPISIEHPAYDRCDLYMEKIL